MAAEFIDKTYLHSIVADSSGTLFLLTYDCSEEMPEILYSIDQGNSWITTSRLPAFTAHSNSRVWINTEDVLFVSGNIDTESGLSVVKSIDGGDSWMNTGLFPSGTLISFLLPIEENYLITGSSRASLFESANGGESWEFLVDLSGSISSLAYIPETRIFAGRQSMDMLSACDWDDPSEWYEIAELPDLMGIDGLFSSSQGFLYAGGEPREEGSSILESTDDGETWTLMNAYSATGVVLDFFESSDGYLYALGNYGVFRSEAPVIPPTPTPSVGPGTPTYTPHPPSPSPTPTTTRTPTPSPTPAPPTSIPTATPVCDGLGVTLIAPANYFAPGSQFYLRIEICNTLHQPLWRIPLFVILEVQNTFWFAPSWSGDPVYYLEDWPTGLTDISIIDEFPWPPDAGSYSGARFYSAMTNTSLTEILGDMDAWEFGWGK